MENIMSIFDDMGKFIKEVVEKVEDVVEDIVEDIADIFDGDDEEDSADAE
jgi:phage-related protein